jgi:DNA-binding CsgD family transcriptional regulator
MEAFSGLLLVLYRQAQIVPPTEFQIRALDAAREALAFDSALWARGAMEPDGGIVHAACVYRQPPDMLENYERIKQHDTLSFEAFSRMGQTVNAALTTDPHWQARFHPDAIAHVKRYGMEHVLATITAEPVLRLFTAVSFYRANPEQPFTEAERLFKQNLMPHLAETWNINRFNFMHSPHNEGIQSGHARAICDKKGVLNNASQGFEELMLAEWPDWHGPQLPGVLLDTLSGTGRCQYTGQVIVGTIKALNDMLLFGVRKISAVDQLSPRELEVAERFGRGMDHRKIAEELHIAPATVRNHLQAIYAKLGVSNKVEMARIIIEAEE